MTIIRASLPWLGIARADIPQLLDDLLVIEQAYAGACVDVWKREQASHEQP